MHRPETISDFLRASRSQEISDITAIGIATMKAPRPEQQRFQGAYEQAVQTFYQVSQVYLTARSSQDREKLLADALNARTLVDIAQTAIMLITPNMAAA